MCMHNLWIRISSHHTTRTRTQVVADATTLNSTSLSVHTKYYSVSSVPHCFRATFCTATMFANVRRVVGKGGHTFRVKSRWIWKSGPIIREIIPAPTAARSLTRKPILWPQSGSCQYLKWLVSFTWRKLLAQTLRIWRHTTKIIAKHFDSRRVQVTNTILSKPRGTWLCATSLFLRGRMKSHSMRWAIWRTNTAQICRPNVQNYMMDVGSIICAHEPSFDWSHWSCANINMIVRTLSRRMWSNYPIHLLVFFCIISPAFILFRNVHMLFIK